MIEQIDLADKHELILCQIDISSNETRFKGLKVLDALEQNIAF